MRKVSPDRAGVVARACLLLAAALALHLPAVTAHAAEEEVSEARRAFVAGRRAYNVGQWKEAIAGFEQSYRLSGDPILLFNLAQAHRQAGHVDQAIATYRAYLRDLPRAENRALVEEKIAELSARRQPGVGPGSSDGDIMDVEERSRGPSRLPRWAPWAGLGLTAALAGTAVLTGMSVRSRERELRDSCGSRPGGCGPEVDRLEGRARLTNILWVASALSAAGTGVAFYYVSSREAAVSVAFKF